VSSFLLFLLTGAERVPPCHDTTPYILLDTYLKILMSFYLVLNDESVDHSSTLKKEAEDSPQTSMPVYQITQRQILEDRNLVCKLLILR
jgi:hypothetical protein